MDPIAEYIRQNRDTYTREALDQRLLDEGYTKEEIEAAWRSLPPAEDAQHAPQVDGVTRTSISGTFVALCIVSIIIGGILVLLTDFVFALSTSYVSNQPALGIRIVGVLVTVGSVVVAVVLVAFGVSRLKKGWSTGRVAGLLVATSLLWYLVIVGTCLTAPTAVG